MTTIATDGRSMAGDGLATSQTVAITDRKMVKVWRLEDGRIVGCAGDRSDALAFRDWLNGSERPKIVKSFEALVLNMDGTAQYFCDPRLIGDIVELPTAIGSGMSFALAAMDAGASPDQAVRIAAERDPFTGGDITVIYREPIA